MEQHEIAARRRTACRRRRKHNLPRQRILPLTTIQVFLLTAFLFLIGFLAGVLVSAGRITGQSAEIVPESDTSRRTSHSPAAAPQGAGAQGSWNLRLVNPWNALPEDYTIETVTLKNGLQVDERCYPDLQAMMDGCRAAGLSPLICSAYRTQEKQARLFQNKVDRLMEQGYSESEAETEAAKVVAVPGTSEHQLGLAVDIADANHQALDETQEDTEVQKWLMAHSWEYGFILRYPHDKSGITGIIYEPWHYRYVGRTDAEEIHASGVCLEEYLGLVTASNGSAGNP